LILPSLRLTLYSGRGVSDLGAVFWGSSFFSVFLVEVSYNLKEKK